MDLNEHGIRIFKYYKINTLNLKTIKSGEIYLSHPSTFNDPFDSIINAKGNDDEILKSISHFIGEEGTDLENDYYSYTDLQHIWGYLDEDDLTTKTPHFTDSLKHLAVNYPFLVGKYKDHILSQNDPKLQDLKRYLRITEKLGVCSFSKINDFESMWAYYADNHRGMCVEYLLDPTKLIDGLMFDEVVYVKDDIYCNISTESDDDLRDRSFIKNDCWRNEKEVRILHTNMTNTCIKFPGKVSSITFGAFTPGHDESIVEDLFKTEKIKLYKMNLEYSSKRLHRQSKHLFEF